MDEDDDIDEVKRLLLAKKKKQVIKTQDLLSTGSTILNLAATGRKEGGFVKGLYHFIVGDSSSGKSWLSLTCLAEAARNPAFDRYEFIHDNAENGALMDLGRYFGGRVKERLRPPKGTMEEPQYSTTIEEFYFNLHTWLNRGPCIYILDSMDALEAEADQEKFEKQKKVHEGKKKEEAGSYGTAKAKANSAGLRMAINKLRKTGSILIIISQTRDKIGFGAMFSPKTRGGGRALRFFNRLEMWTSVREKLWKKVLDKERHIGTKIKVEIVKNHLTGWEGEFFLLFYNSYGIDDISSCIDYLVDEGKWSDEKGVLKAPEFAFSGRRKDLITQIEEDDDLLERLRRLVEEVWNEIVERSKVKRKLRYE